MTVGSCSSTVPWAAASRRHTPLPRTHLVTTSAACGHGLSPLVHIWCIYAAGAYRRLRVHRAGHPRHAGAGAQGRALRGQPRRILLGARCGWGVCAARSVAALRHRVGPFQQAAAVPRHAQTRPRSQPPMRPPTALDSHPSCSGLPSAQGYPLNPRGEPGQLGCRRGGCGGAPMPGLRR